MLVLIDADADGYIVGISSAKDQKTGPHMLQFQEDYYRDISGGRNAAIDLETAVKEHLKSSHPELSNLPIMIKAFANADGLSQVLAKAKITKSPRSLDSFVKGFSQARDASDFVLVGSGKDRADEKVKG